ncbi:MAG: PDR/VanB family oxidoreductase [Jatrophihabitans sp.]
MTDRDHRSTSSTIRALAVIIAAFEKVSGFSGYLRPEPTAVDRRIRMRIAAMDPEADEVVSLRLEPLDQAWLPSWRPGAHLDVELPGGLLRQYSLCGDPAARDHFRVAVRLIADGGGGSRAVHALRPGDELTVRGPRNAFPFIDTDRYLFVAGGIGVTPIRAMIGDAARRGADWTFVYTGRTRTSMPFLNEFAALDPDRVHVWPDDEFGLPDGARIVALAAEGAALYTCGPPAMIAAIRAQLPAANISSLHCERFSPPPVVGGRAFDLVLARSGLVLRVGADQSALSAIQQVLPNVAYSCRQGFCGTCPVRLIDGRVEHHDRCLTDEQRADQMAICVSRADGRATLDL